MESSGNGRTKKTDQHHDSAANRCSPNSQALCSAFFAGFAKGANASARPNRRPELGFCYGADRVHEGCSPVMPLTPKRRSCHVMPSQRARSAEPVNWATMHAMHTLLGLPIDRVELPRPLLDDIEFVERMLGAMLAEQEQGDVLAIARHLYRENDDADPATLFERVPQLRDPHLVQRVLRAYTLL